MSRKNRVFQLWPVAIILAVTLLSSSSFAKYSGGSGDPNDPYQIANVSDLMTLANDANDYNKCFIMTADIDLASYTFTTAVIAYDINRLNYSFDGNAFNGIFDGSGNKILNLTIDTNEVRNSYLGLFGCVNDGEIKNLGLENINITGIEASECAYVGGLVGYKYYGSIRNCYSTGAITGIRMSNWLGGLVGYNWSGSISSCRSTCAVTGKEFSYELGGLLGENNSGDINNCYSTGDVNGGSSSSERLGGFVGNNRSGYINNCHSTGSVTSGSDAIGLGGLAGKNFDGDINNCYSTSEVSSGKPSDMLGGLVGWNEGSIRNCYTAGAVVGGINASDSGGIAGDNSGTISNCYSVTLVGGINVWYSGGIAGYNSGTVSNCYSTGIVNGTHYVGGLLGNNYLGSISNSYFLDVAGPNNGLGTPLTDSQMKQQASFVGWDFVWETTNGPNDIWAICEDVSYPKLAWQYVVGDSDSDKDVDFIDFAPFGNKWMEADSTLYCGGTDLTGDGFVNLEDLAAFVENWLQ